jgi:hypothetical protein
VRLGNQLVKKSFGALLGLSAALARRERLTPVTGALMRGLATATIRMKGLREARTVAELGDQWQRAFPSRKQVPITRVDETTVYGEIHTQCPLRGSGDVLACYRMMEFDREILRKAGGEFVVLASQAEPGRKHCEVAMRPAGAALTDLVPAHIRVREGMST